MTKNKVRTVKGSIAKWLKPDGVEFYVGYYREPDNVSNRLIEINGSCVLIDCKNHCQRTLLECFVADATYIGDLGYKGKDIVPKGTTMTPFTGA